MKKLFDMRELRLVLILSSDHSKRCRMPYLSAWEVNLPYLKFRIKSPEHLRKLNKYRRKHHQEPIDLKRLLFEQKLDKQNQESQFAEAMRLKQEARDEAAAI